MHPPLKIKIGDRVTIKKNISFNVGLNVSPAVTFSGKVTGIAGQNSDILEIDGMPAMGRIRDVIHMESK